MSRVLGRRARTVLRGRGRSNASTLPGGLELEDEGFHFSVLSGFRARLVENGAEQVVLDRLLARLSELGSFAQADACALKPPMSWRWYGT